MFPGDPASKAPSFAALGFDASTLDNLDLVQLLDCALSDFPQTKMTDINQLLSVLRNSHPQLIKEFIDAALVAYFTAPQVIIAIRGGPETLFPHVWPLPDIDYELLEPVFERGAPGRS